MVKILPKKELVSLEQKEEERQVKWAEKLTADINSLMERKITEEANLEKWRIAAFKQVQDDIDAKALEIRGLDSQIEAKKKEWQRLLEPLDKQFALMVKTEKARLEKWQSSLEEERADIALKQHEQDIKSQEQAKTALHFKQERTEISKLFETARSNADSAREELAQARNDAQRILSEAELKMEEAKDFERDIQLKASDFKIQKDALDAFKKELDDRETQIIMKELQQYSPIQKL